MTIADLSILFRPFGFIAPKTLIYLAFKYFGFESTWWRLLQKRVVGTNCDIYVFITIILFDFILHRGGDISFHTNKLLLSI